MNLDLLELLEVVDEGRLAGPDVTFDGDGEGARNLLGYLRQRLKVRSGQKRNFSLLSLERKFGNKGTKHPPNFFFQLRIQLFCRLVAISRNFDALDENQSDFLIKATGRRHLRFAEISKNKNFSPSSKFNFGKNLRKFRLKLAQVKPKV